MVSQVWDRMNDRTWNESTRQSQLSDPSEVLRSALPDFIAQAMDREGFFKQRLGFAFGERLGRRYSESQVRIERDVHDRHGKEVQPFYLQSTCQNSERLAGLLPSFVHKPHRAGCKSGIR
jgi:hypothetical protein